MCVGGVECVRGWSRVCAWVSRVCAWVESSVCVGGVECVRGRSRVCAWVESSVCVGGVECVRGWSRVCAWVELSVCEVRIEYMLWLESCGCSRAGFSKINSSYTDMWGYATNLRKLIWQLLYCTHGWGNYYNSRSCAIKHLL